MAIRNILQEGDPTLGKKSRDITDFNERLHILLDDMHETLTEANGLGLAAPQVGVLRRAALIVDMNTKADPPIETVYELINPEIIEQSGEQEGTEGLAAERIFIKESVLQSCGKLLVGSKISISYNRYGKPEHVDVLDLSKK